MDTGIDWLLWLEELLKNAAVFGRDWLIGLWNVLVELQARYPQLLSPQTLFGVLGSGIGVWRWWEGREKNLYRRFEAMIARQETRLVKAGSDLVDLINRPGPGLLVRVPAFAEKPLRKVLARRGWSGVLSMLGGGHSVDRRLAAAIVTCERKVDAHIARLSFFRQQMASAYLIEGSLAAARAARSTEEHQRQMLDQESLDRFRGVLAIPGHNRDVSALEFIARQLFRLDWQSQSAVDAYSTAHDALKDKPEGRAKNVALARTKRSLAILRYPSAPVSALTLLTDAADLLTQFGPPRDRDLLELAETAHLEAIARLRLGQNIIAPQRLSQAQGHYRDLLRSLEARKGGLFRWMLLGRKWSGHRTKELNARASAGLAQLEHLLELNDRHQKLLIKSLARGTGVPRPSRRLPSMR